MQKESGTSKGVKIHLEKKYRLGRDLVAEVVMLLQHCLD